MHWFDVWECLMNEKTLAKLDKTQQLFLPQLKERADTMKRLEARREHHREKYNTMQKKGIWRSVTYKYEELYETAKYFERYYNDKFEKRKRPLTSDPHFSGLGYSGHGSIAPDTKNKNYLYQRYEENIKKIRAEQEKEGKAYDYETFLLIFYLRLPIYVFEAQERTLFRDMFEFARKKKLVFRVTKRSSRRNTEELKMTYLEFCEWYAEHGGEYSCNDRFFVPLFCKNSEIVQKNNISKATVDNLLRYDAFSDCFTENDLKAMKLGKKVEDFFDAMELIRETSKKK